MFGVDEAGRGPVLGSMFVACVATEETANLPDGLRDSKRLSKSRIQSLAQNLRTAEGVSTTVVEVPTDRIDDPETTMTDVTVEAFARAIDALELDGGAGILDACHTDADVFRDLVADAVDCSPSLEAEHGADDEYPIVSAASIIAKDARERHVAELADEYGEVGSGYPSDPTTREFLEQHVETTGTLPECARVSWGTCDDVLAEAEQQTLDES